MKERIKRYMKLKKLISSIIVASMTISAVSVYAAGEEESIKFGTPIDVLTKEAVTSLKTGQYIAVPVEVTTTTGGVSSFQFKLKYTALKDYLQGGIESDTVYNDDTLYGAIEDLGDMVENTEATYVAAVNNCKTLRGSRATYIGQSGVNPDSHALGEDNKLLAYTWASDRAYSYLTNEPEAYILFTVIKDLETESLNYNIFDFLQTEADSRMGDTYNSVPSHGNIPGGTSKLNVCEGAFKLTVDPKNLTSGVYINSLKARVNAGADVDIVNGTENADGTYTFPVRLTGSTGGTATVVISGTYGDSETDESGNTPFALPEFDVTLNSPTDYETPTGATVKLTK